MATLLDRNSKADTRLLVTGGGGLDFDQSQWRADLTDNTTYLTSGDARLAVRSPREISVVVDLSTADDRVLLNWGRDDGSTYTYRITIGSGEVFAGHNDANLISVNPPNLSGSAKSYLIHWCTDYDLIAGSYYSEIAVCDIGANEWEVARIEHDQPNAPNPGDQFNIIGYGPGDSPFTGGLSAIDAVRIGCRFHSVCEASEDFVSESAAPTITGIQPTVELAPSSTSFFSADPAEDVANAMLDEGTFAGPIEYAANINATAQRRRLLSPLLNISPNNPPAYSDAYFPDNMFRQVATQAPYTGRHFVLSHVYWRPCSFRGKRARVRVHAQTYLEAGAPMGSAIDIELSMFSLGDKPGKKVPGAISGVSTTAVALTTDHTDSGVGQWYDLGDLPILPDGLGLGTWLALAIEFGTGTGHEFMRLRVKAITVEPYED